MVGLFAYRACRDHPGFHAHHLTCRYVGCAYDSARLLLAGPRSALAGAGFCGSLDSVDLVTPHRHRRNSGRTLCPETPLVAALTVPTLIIIILGVQGLIMGVLEIIGGFKGGGIGSFILGAISLLIGLLLLSSPVAAALAVPFVFGVLLLIEGVALIAWAFRVR